MHTVTFCSFKGGTAKTSVAMHLGCCISKQHKVLLVDLDPQANLSVGLGINPESIDTMESVFRDRQKITETIMNTNIKNVDIIPSNAHIDGVERSPELSNNPYAHELLRNVLKEVSDEYDFCFIDTPPSLGWLTQSAFFASDGSVICATPEAYSIIALRGLQTFHENINKYHRVDPVGVVLSFWNDRGAVNNEFLEEIDNCFPNKLFKTKIRRDMHVSRAVLRGEPVTKIAPASRASKDYKSLSKEFLKRVSIINSKQGVAARG